MLSCLSRRRQKPYQRRRGILFYLVDKINNTLHNTYYCDDRCIWHVNIYRANV